MPTDYLMAILVVLVVCIVLVVCATRKPKGD